MVVVLAKSLAEAREIAARDPMHKSGARKFTVRPWFVNEGTILVRLNYSKGGFEMIQADERRAQTPRGQSKQMPVSIRCYPFGAGEMALEGLPRPIRFVVGIDLQHDPRHLALVDKLPCTKLRDGVIAHLTVAEGLGLCSQNIFARASYRHWRTPLTPSSGGTTYPVPSIQVTCTGTRYEHAFKHQSRHHAF